MIGKIPTAVPYMYLSRYGAGGRQVRMPASLGIFLVILSQNFGDYGLYRILRTKIEKHYL
jgi:hypothetical protein